MSSRCSRLRTDESAAALALSASSLGNTRCETLRAFSFEEMRRTLGKMV